MANNRSSGNARKAAPESADHLPLSRMRNIGIIAHIDAGKTTTTEKMLFHSGRLHRSGGVDDGTTVTDWMVQERERGITIVSAATTFNWRDCQLTLIDTPGHVDFTMEVERSLRVLDGAVGIFCAVGGVQSQSETVWRQADRYSVPRIAYINKMDRPGADFYGLLREMTERLESMPCPIQLPIGEGAAFRGVIDLVNMEMVEYGDDSGTLISRGPISPDLAENAARFRRQMLEVLADYDEELMGLYLEEKDIPPALVTRVLRRLTIGDRILPVLCGSSFRSRGVQLLMDAVCDLLPSPADLPPVTGRHPDTDEPVERAPEFEEEFTGLIFKIATDPFVGRLSYLRVYSGRLKSGGSVYNSNRGRKERVNRILRMHGNRSEPLEETVAGEIVALIGLKGTKAGDSLCNQKHPVILEGTFVPEPVVSMAIEPRTRGDSDKLGEAMNRLVEEDPTFRVRVNSETGQTIVSGMGELHLDIIKDRLTREFGVDARVSAPQVSYRETITRPAEAEGRFVRQTGGSGQYGHVLVRMEPLPRGSGLIFEVEIRGQDVPREYFPAVEAGIREAAQTGVLKGYPVIDLKVVLYDGSHHPVDSSEIAFRLAGAIAFREAAARASAIVLEPVMKMEITTPEDFLGDVIGDFTARRGKVSEIMDRGKVKILRGVAPLVGLFGYATSLRSLSQGRAVYVMEPSHYEPVPDSAMP